MGIQLLISQAGPLPIEVNFNAESDEQGYLEVNGSVWSQQTNTMLGIGIYIDGQQVGEAQVFSNGSTTHRPVVPAYIPVSLSIGQSHTLTLQVLNSSTVSDYNDFYTAVIHL